MRHCSKFPLVSLTKSVIVELWGEKKKLAVVVQIKSLYCTLQRLPITCLSPPQKNHTFHAHIYKPGQFPLSTVENWHRIIYQLSITLSHPTLYWCTLVEIVYLFHIDLQMLQSETSLLFYFFVEQYGFCVSKVSHQNICFQCILRICKGPLETPLKSNWSHGEISTTRTIYAKMDNSVD